MTQSDKDKIEHLEKMLAVLSMRVEDEVNELRSRLDILEKVLKTSRKTKVQQISPSALKKIQSGQYMSYTPDGSNCGCSPKGMPHSVDCKGFNFSKGPSYEDILRQERNRS